MSKIDKVPEKEFIELCRRGKTVKEIGEIFGISRDSVRRIKNNLRERGINIENENKERYRDTLPIGEIIRYYELKNKNTGSSVMTLDEIAAKYGVTRTTISTIVNEYYESIGKDRPERHGGWQISKLPRKDIYEAWKNGTSQYVLAEQYNVTRPNIDFLIKAY